MSVLFRSSPMSCWTVYEPVAACPAMTALFFPHGPIHPRLFLQALPTNRGALCMALPVG